MSASSPLSSIPQLQINQEIFQFTCNLPLTVSPETESNLDSSSDSSFRPFFSKFPSSLQAWDSADLYLYSLLTDPQSILETHTLGPESPLTQNLQKWVSLRNQRSSLPSNSSFNLLITHDQWGVLSTLVASLFPQARIVCVHDSRITQRALAFHLKVNQISNPQRVCFVPHYSAFIQYLKDQNPQDQSLPLNESEGSQNLFSLQDDLFNSFKFDLALTKVPKNHEYLYETLHSFSSSFHKDTLVFGATLSKYITSTLIQDLNTQIGPTQTSRASKKARFFALQPNEHFLDTERTQNPSLGQSKHHCYGLEGTPFKLQNGSHTFSKKHLDVGTRLLIQHFPQDLEDQIRPHTVLDLGCGNGALGIAYTSLYPTAQMTFTDVSFQALAYAQRNFNSAFDDKDAQFCALDGLENRWSDFFDLVLLNPPFHQGHAQDQNLGKRLVEDAYHALKRGGWIYLVGNRHLNYHLVLKKRFGHFIQKSQHRKFTVICAQKK